MKSASEVKEVPYIRNVLSAQTQYALDRFARHVAPSLPPEPLKWTVKHMEEAECFYWMPAEDLGTVHVKNYGAPWEGDMSTEAFGLVVSEYFFAEAANQFSNMGENDLARKMSDLYHKLRHEIYSDDGPHPEHSAIWSALD